MDRPFSFFTSLALPNHPSSTQPLPHVRLLSRAHSASASTAVGTTSIPLLYLWLSFQLLNQVLLPILVVTFVVSKSVKRHCTVVNVCVTWIVAGIISSLLWYAGKQSGPEPPKLLCMSQATLLIGVPPMTSVAILAMIYQMNTAMRHTQRPPAEADRMRNIIMVSLPYAAFICFSLVAASLAVHVPQNISRQRRFFYCSFNSPMTNAFAIFTALILITTLGYSVAASIFLRKNWAALRQSGTLDLQFLGRMGIFVAYVCLTLILSIVSIFAPRTPFPDLATASVGTVLALILASHPDVYRTWLRRSKPPPTSITSMWTDGNEEGEGKGGMPFDVEKDGYTMRDGDEEEKKGRMHFDEEMGGEKVRNGDGKRGIGGIQVNLKAVVQYDLVPPMQVRVLVEEHRYDDEDLKQQDRNDDGDDESVHGVKEKDITLRPYSYF